MQRALMLRIVLDPPRWQGCAVQAVLDGPNAVAELVLVVSGRDEMGCLLMGHDFKAWWIGSLLDIEETRRLVPGQNATTLQVAASVLGALFWMIRNPQEARDLLERRPESTRIIHFTDRKHTRALVDGFVEALPGHFADA